jgi:hypothetical protein
VAYEAIFTLAFGRKWMNYRRQFNDELRSGMFNDCEQADIQQHIERRLGLPWFTRR